MLSSGSSKMDLASVLLHAYSVQGCKQFSFPLVFKALFQISEMAEVLELYGYST